MMHISLHVKKKVASRQAKPPFVIHRTGPKKYLLFSIQIPIRKRGWCGSGGIRSSKTDAGPSHRTWRDGMEKQRSKQVAASVAVAIWAGLTRGLQQLDHLTSVAWEIKREREDAEISGSDKAGHGWV